MRQLLTAVLLTLFIGCGTDSHETADSVYMSGSIYTMNPAQAWAEALAVRVLRLSLWEATKRFHAG